MCVKAKAVFPPLQPLHVVCPEQYTQPPLTQSHRSDLMLELQPPPMPYRRCSVLNLPFRRRYERIYVLPEVRSEEKELVHV